MKDKVVMWLTAFCLLSSMSTLYMVISNRSVITVILTERRSFEQRTIDRWEYTRKFNPQLNLPRVEEPNDRSHLTEDEMKGRK